MMGQAQNQAGGMMGQAKGMMGQAQNMGGGMMGKAKGMAGKAKGKAGGMMGKAKGMMGHAEEEDEFSFGGFGDSLGAMAKQAAHDMKVKAEENDKVKALEAMAHNAMGMFGHAEESEEVDE